MKNKQAGGAAYFFLLKPNRKGKQRQHSRNGKSTTVLLVCMAEE
jgi:hypothetical protein